MKYQLNLDAVRRHTWRMTRRRHAWYNEANLSLMTRQSCALTDERGFRGGYRRRHGGDASATGVCTCSRPLTNFYAYSVRPCAKLKAKLTVRYAKVFIFLGSLAPESHTMVYTPGSCSRLRPQSSVILLRRHFLDPLLCVSIQRWSRFFCPELWH